MTYLLIAAFGVLGVLARYGVGALAASFLPLDFPYGTFLINLTGAFAIGIVYVLGFERSAIPHELRAGLMVGFLGGFTTFSSYCLETVRLFEDGSPGRALFYLAGSPVLGLAASWGGIALTRVTLGP